MLLLITLGGLALPLALGAWVISSDWRDGYKTAALWIGWAPAALGGAVLGALVARAFGLD